MQERARAVSNSEGLDPAPRVGRNSIFADRRMQGQPAKRIEALESRYRAPQSSTGSRGGGAGNGAARG